MEELKEKKAFIKAIKVGSCANGEQVKGIGITKKMINDDNEHIISLLTKDGSLWIYRYETDLYHCVYQRKSYKSK